MTPEILNGTDELSEGIKHVPQDAAVRRSLRETAVQLALPLNRSRPLLRADIERHGRTILEQLALPRRYLGFAMVAVSNEFWRPTLASTPFHRRLFLLPHCLSDRDACTGRYDTVGLHCAGCGNCDIDALKRQAEQLGYLVIVAEGTSSVLETVLDDNADAIIGVACLDSLEKSFQRVIELGVPHMALPLLRDGCVDTVAEVDEIRTLLAATSDVSVVAPRSYIPLLRETARVFHEPAFATLLAPHEDSLVAADAANDWLSVEDIALEWLKEGGKRLRPFVTMAAYAVARAGATVLNRGDTVGAEIPPSIRRLAIAIEALHKASLVHDDIEDNDEFRYGAPTLYRVHGLAQAVNVGDYLIGLGYRLVAGETAELGAGCVADILDRLSQAHLELCRGQGAELAWQNRPQDSHRAMDVLTVYAKKTAPAFEVALFTGLRAAGIAMEADSLRRFCTYIGEGFQIRNDLDDWTADNRNKRTSGQDVLAGRPTILRAFAAENGFAEELRTLADRDGQLPAEELVERVRHIYSRSGAFAKAEQLLEKLRDRALAVASDFPSEDLQELMRFLVRVILPEPVESESPLP
jgi:geranylgeranyl diphosphate synthase, type II